MKKLYILPLLVAGLQFAACSSEDESIFDQSAAERLESGQKEYFQALCADGGTWAMEYFSNVEEPGYLFVLQFESDKSVTIHTDHKWIGNTYKSEKSLWDVINDNGNVLTFNSYNTLFHLFATPENIEGPDAPKDDNNEDVDEEGYGHNGDYEFLLMENDGQNIRLRGKKRALYTYLRKLPSDVNIQDYLANARALRTQFDARRFPNYVMTETATGAQYDITGLSDGVVNIVPLNSTSPYARTVTQPCIITAAGMRPEAAFDCIREDDSHFTVNEFTWASDGALVAPGVRLTAPSAATNLSRKDLNWTMITTSFSEAINSALDAANAETSQISIKDFGRNPQVTDLSIGYSNYKGRITFNISGKVGSIPYIYYGNCEATASNRVKFTLTAPNDAIEIYIQELAPKAVELLKLFEGEFAIKNVNELNPSQIDFVGITNPNLTFSVRVK